MIHNVRQDVTYALRMLAVRPALAGVIVLTIGLAVGANTAIFAVVNGVLLKPLGLPDPDRLVVIGESMPLRPEVRVAYPDFLDWRVRQRTFDRLAASLVTGGILTGQGAEPERVFGRAVSHDFFQTIDVRLHLGRSFTAAEDRPGGEPVVVLGFGLWRQRYGSNPGVVGRAITYNSASYNVVGVMPREFEFYGRTEANNDIFFPLGQLADESFMRDRGSHPVWVLGRLTSGKSIADARAELSGIAAALALEHPDTNRGVGVFVRSLLDDYVGDVRMALLTLLAAALLVLAIASANIATLLLARATSRRQEMAVRMALGAGRTRIVQQLLTESLVLSCAGGLLGTVLGAWGTSLLPALAPDALPRATEISVDTAVIAFAIGVTVVAGLLFGIVSAVQAVGTVPRRWARDARGLTATRSRLRDALIVGEMACCVALLVGAGLLLRSFAALRHVDPGFQPDHVVSMRLRLPDAQYRERTQVNALLQALLPRLSAVPGVEAACLTTGIPLGRSNEERFTIAARPEPPKNEQPVALVQWVTTDYHRTLGIAVLAGRSVAPTDRSEAPQVAVVDDVLAREYFPGESPGRVLGRRIRLSSEGPRWREIVGVVRHIRHSGLDEAPQPQIYVPYEQMEPGWQLQIGRAMDIGVRSRRDPAAIVSAIRREVQALDPALPLSHVRTLNDALSVWMAPRRFNLTLLAAFASTALVLCVLGVYGAVSYVVQQRTREIGVRVALGATHRHVIQLVLHGTTQLIALGLVGGVAVGWAGSRLFASLLYGITPDDPVTFGAAAILLGAVALAATYVPVRRALRIDPMIALREE
jgi:putative ABC transport system permease protein